jgi:hypothetical protein
LIGVLLCVVSAGFAETAQAQSAYLNALQRSNYVVMSGDYNGDGYMDILMIAKQRIVIIDYDIPIPIAIPTPSPSFVLLSSGPVNFTLSTNVTAEMIASPVWQSGGYDLIYGDITGNGAGGVFLRARTVGGLSVSIVASQSNGVPQLLQVISAGSLGMDISGPTLSILLGDSNGDGRADLTVQQNGATQAVFLADSNGRYSAPFDQSSMSAVWSGLRAALANGETTQALQFVAPETRSSYGQAMTDVGVEEMRANTAGWSQFSVASQDGDLGVGKVSVAENGGTSTYIITFIRLDGLWYVESF